jgi:chemotaxis protein CheD
VKTHLIGLGEMAVTRTPGEEIKALALGSCVALALLDATTRTVGMAHVALPDSRIDPARAAMLPGYFADTAVPALLVQMHRVGSNGCAHRLWVKLVGGATLLDPDQHFNIGRRNALALKRVLWQYGLGAIGEDLGGEFSRTVVVDVDHGRVRVSSLGRTDWDV